VPKPPNARHRHQFTLKALPAQDLRKLPWSPRLSSRFSSCESPFPLAALHVPQAHPLASVVPPPRSKNALNREKPTCEAEFPSTRSFAHFAFRLRSSTPRPSSLSAAGRHPLDVRLHNGARYRGGNSVLSSATQAKRPAEMCVFFPLSRADGVTARRHHPTPSRIPRTTSVCKSNIVAFSSGRAANRDGVGVAARRAVTFCVLCRYVPTMARDRG
jgi:hypothetical protein